MSWARSPVRGAGMQARRLAVWMIVLALFAAPAAAQNASEEEARETVEGFEEYVEVDTSALPDSNSVTTKLPVPIADTPANVGVVPAVVLDEQRATVLGDALVNVSGVNVVAGSGVHDFFVVRGFDSLSSGLVLTDGAPEPEVSFYQTYNVEGVELLKGPAGFLYGKDPLAGVVNVVRKQPLPTDLGRLSLWGGSFGTAEGRLDWNEASADGSRALRINGVWQQSDRYRDLAANAGGIGDSATRFAAVNPSFAWRFPGGGRVNVNLEAVDAEYAPDSGLPLWRGVTGFGALELPAAVPRERSYQSPFDFSDQRLHRFQVDFEQPLSERVALRNKTYYRALDWETAGTLLLGVFDIPLGPGFTLEDQVLRTLTGLDDRQRVIGNQWEAALELTTGSVSHRLLAGVELARITDDFALSVDNPAAGGLPPLDLFAPVETATLPPLFPFVVGETTAEITAPYVIDQIGFSEAVQLLLGLRWDDIETELDYAAAPPGFDSGTRDDSELSPMAGLVVKPAERLVLYANAGQSHSPIGARVSGALHLDPEESRQLELGARRRFSGLELQGTVAVYRIDRENVAITGPGGFTQNAGDQRSEGLEIELAAEPLPRLRTLLAYGYNDSELTRFTDFDPLFMVPVDFSGNRPAFAPEHLGRLWVSRDFTRGLALAGGLRWFSDQYISEDNAFEADGALLVDLSATWDWQALRIRLDLRNVTDEEYLTRGVGSSFSRAAVPGDPAAAYAGVDYRF